LLLPYLSLRPRGSIRLCQLNPKAHLIASSALGFLYDYILVSAVPNAGAHHEFKGLDIPVKFECPTSPLKITDGKIKVPTGPGMGVIIDPDFIKKHQPVKL